MNTIIKLKMCPEPGEGVHQWLFHAACRAVEAGLTNEEAVDQIEPLMTRDPSPTEIEDALRSARGERGPSAPRWTPPNPEKIAAIAKEGPTVVELVSRSPQPIQFGQPSRAEEIVDALFSQDSWLCVGKSDREFHTQQRELWGGHLCRQSLIVPSPMSSQKGLTKQGKLSFHSQANTGPRRFLVVEFDGCKLDQQASLLWHLAKYAPLALVTFSGGKSLHTFFYCAGQPEDKLRRFFDYAVSLGADSKLWNPSQFVRMPDGKRNDGKASNALQVAGIANSPIGRQAVVFFNPEVIR